LNGEATDQLPGDDTDDDSETSEQDPSTEVPSEQLISAESVLTNSISVAFSLIKASSISGLYLSHKYDCQMLQFWFSNSEPYVVNANFTDDPA
jgi:hypothetical protein